MIYSSAHLLPTAQGRTAGRFIPKRRTASRMDAVLLPVPRLSSPDSRTTCSATGAETCRRFSGFSVSSHCGKYPAPSHRGDGTYLTLSYCSRNGCMGQDTPGCSPGTARSRRSIAPLFLPCTSRPVLWIRASLTEPGARGAVVRIDRATAVVRAHPCPESRWQAAVSFGTGC